MLSSYQELHATTATEVSSPLSAEELPSYHSSPSLPHQDDVVSEHQDDVVSEESLVILASKHPIATSLRLVEAWMEDEWSAAKAEELRRMRCHDVLIFRYLLDPPSDSSSISSLVRILTKASFLVPVELAGLLQSVNAELQVLRHHQGHFERIAAIIAGKAKIVTLGLTDGR